MKRERLTFILVGLLFGVLSGSFVGCGSKMTERNPLYTKTQNITEPHFIEILAVDEFRESNSSSLEFSVDGTAPKVDITAPAAGDFTMAQPTFTATFSDAGAGVASVTATLNGKDVISQASINMIPGILSFTPGTALKDGEHTFTVTVTDVAGNSATDEITIQVDNTAPSLTIVSPEAAAYVDAGDLVIKAEFDEAGSGVKTDCVEVAIDGKAVEVEPTSSGVTYRPALGSLEPGPHNLTIKVCDDLGNQTEETITFTLGAAELSVSEVYNFPNSFDNETTLRIKLTKRANVSIKVYDMDSDLVATMVDKEVKIPGNGGAVDFRWGGHNDNGDQVANGVYFARIVVEDGSKTVVKIIKVALLR